jgi:hypothetical protein
MSKNCEWKKWKLLEKSFKSSNRYQNFLELYPEPDFADCLGSRSNNIRAHTTVGLVNSIKTKLNTPPSSPKARRMSRRARKSQRRATARRSRK